MTVLGVTLYVFKKLANETPFFGIYTGLMEFLYYQGAFIYRELGSLGGKSLRKGFTM
jgi:hypothetical protein